MTECGIGISSEGVLSAAPRGALGYAVSFSAKVRSSQIRRARYYGIRSDQRYRADLRRYADDAVHRKWPPVGHDGMTRGVGGRSSLYRTLLRDWLKTQESKYSRISGYAWLGNISDCTARAPKTHLAALHSVNMDRLRRRSTTARCGGVMRVALSDCTSMTWKGCRDICRFGAETTALTHGHPHGWMPAALVQIIHEVSQDGAIMLDAVLHSLNTIDEIYPETKSGLLLPT